MIPHYRNIHNRFKINGFHIEKQSLFQLAYSLIKEGASFEKEFGEFLLDWIDDKETIVLTTSGTTGMPKNIIVNKQAMVNSAIATANFFDLRPGDTILHALPSRYIAGKMMLVRAIIIGLEIDLIAPNSHLNDLLPNKKYDFTALVPLQAENSLDKLYQFKKIIIGGAKVSDDLALKLQTIPSDIYETYGMTETLTHIAARKIGEPFFNVLEHASISKDERACLVIEAPTITDGKIITNDIVEIQNNRQFQWLGRYDNVINSGGIKLFPEQIEAKLASQIGVPFFIASEPDPILGHKVILVLESDKEISLSSHVFDGLEKFEKPKATYLVSHFVRTETTKINRTETLKKIKVNVS